MCYGMKANPVIHCIIPAFCRGAGLVLALIALASCTFHEQEYSSETVDRPADFVSSHSIIPAATLDIRYAGTNNFIGEPIDGYLAAKCLLTRQAATALQKVQQDLLTKQLSLMIYDCYRPQAAVNQFVRWAKDLKDTRMKRQYYPHVAKSELFAKGYIAAQSSHSRGSTVDVSLVSVTLPNPPCFPAARGMPGHYPMGTPFDYFGPLSHTDNPAVTGFAAKCRQLLKAVMTKHGFKNLAEEWWHYTLHDEPYPNTYFNFPVE